MSAALRLGKARRERAYQMTTLRWRAHHLVRQALDVRRNARLDEDKRRQVERAIDAALKLANLQDALAAAQERTGLVEQQITRH